MTAASMGSLARCCLVATAVVIVPSIAVAQTGTEANREAPVIREHFGIGVLAGIGIPGGIFAVRGSLPVAPRLGIDIDVGRVTGHGTTVNGQLRWHWRGRSATGSSPHLIFGVERVRVCAHAEVRWPGGGVTTLEECKSAVPQFGIGWDGLAGNGTRVGIQLTTGAAGEQMPIAHAKFFVVWGPAVR